MKGRLASLLLAVCTSLSLAVMAAEPSANPSARPAEATRAAHTAVNINQADAATLQRELNGIGAVKAQAIVAYREANGPFASLDELLEVKGIGASTLEKNRARLSLE